MFTDRLHFFLFPLTSTLFTLVSFDMGSNYVFNIDRECKYSSVLFWISSIHSVYKYKFIIVLRFSSNQVHSGMITHCIQISRTFPYLCTFYFKGYSLAVEAGCE